MKIVLFTHYPGFKTASMPRFAAMIATAMQARGHIVEEWRCPVVFGSKSKRPVLAKWLGYLDQFLIFPRQVKRRLRATSADTLFVITDQALGIWVPLVAHRPHVIHCHDFLAQRSALGEIDENPVGMTGRLYQWLIRRGYRQGRHFLSVSRKTQEDLHRFLVHEPASSEVVYNGLNHPFRPMPRDEAEHALAGILHPGEEQGILLHVGGNQWYKNRLGVVAVYASYVRQTARPLPLWLAGEAPDPALRAAADAVSSPGCVRFLEGLDNHQVNAAYNLARALIFPSRAEGFGWPIAEAMACGTPVITVDAPPMNEVGGAAAVYLPVPPADVFGSWAEQGAAALERVLSTPAEAMREDRLLQSGRFSAEDAADAYEQAYRQILAESEA